MKNVGIVRKMDKLGRIVIPKEIRNKYQLEGDTEIEIYTEENKIVLRKYKDTFCPKCLTRCEHTDKYCKECGINFKELYKNAETIYMEKEKNDC